MKLERYIKDLLYRYDCVIVPEFGAFIANHKSAKVEEQNFKPPFKQITFNTLIQNNDGLLANHIAQVDKIPYKTAINYIKFEVEEWVNKLLDNELILEDIGNFYMVDDTINFEVNDTINYLTSSFGLTSFISDKITRESEKVVNNSFVYKKQVEKIENQAPIYINVEKRKKTAYFIKYAAIFVLGFSIIGLGKKAYDTKIEKDYIVALEKQQKINTNKIQTATFVIDSPLPTINISTVAPIKKYHIIAGAFRSEQNALNKVAQLNSNGFNASIVGKNKWNLTQVAFYSFSSLEKANNKLAMIKKHTAKDAWLLIKE